jgi:hypothetical protein
MCTDLASRSRSYLGRLLIASVVSIVVSSAGVATQQPAAGSPCALSFNSPVFVPMTATLGEIFIGDACQHVYVTNTSMNRMEDFSVQTLSLNAPIQAIHITELRTRIDAQRTRFSLSPFNWTDAPLARVPIRAIHVAELRTAIQEAYLGATRTPPTFTDPTLTPGTSIIRVVHINELRNAVLALEGR